MKLLGIDQGTTGTRACLVDAETLVIERQVYAAHAQIQPAPDCIEHDANEIWQNTQRVVDEVLRGEHVDGIAIANQGETCLVWDGERPLHNALVWQDTRTAAAVSQLDPAIDVRALTGLRLDPYFSAPKLQWLLQRYPASRAGTLETFLIERMSGVYATDASTAARTLLCEIDRAAWSDELCALFDVPRARLAEIRDTDGGFGEWRGVPIIASIVDQPAALAGQGCIDRGDAKATFGTGCFVYANTGETRPEAGDMLATVAWRSRGRTTYALDGGVLAVGSAFAWLRELGLLAGEELAWQKTDVVCVPALVGLGAPHWDRTARAAWLNMSSASTKADLVSAVIDGICCRVAEVVDAIERAGGSRIDLLRADGGLTRSPALMQRQADLLGRPIAVAEEDEATVVGACALAARRLGVLSDADLRARKQRTKITYEPRISDDERAATRTRFTSSLLAVRAGLRSSS